MDPLAALAIGVGGAMVGASIHGHGVDQGYAYGYQDGRVQGRSEGYAFGLQQGRNEAVAETRQLRAEMAELKAVVQELQGKQQIAELVEAVKKALPSGGWIDLLNGGGNGQNPDS